MNRGKRQETRKKKRARVSRKQNPEDLFYGKEQHCLFVIDSVEVNIYE
jgi:hypothetical protein